MGCRVEGSSPAVFKKASGLWRVLEQGIAMAWNLPFYFLFFPLRCCLILPSLYRQTSSVVLVTNDRLRGLRAVTVHASWVQPHSKGMTLPLLVTV